MNTLNKWGNVVDLYNDFLNIDGYTKLGFRWLFADYIQNGTDDFSKLEGKLLTYDSFFLKLNPSQSNTLSKIIELFKDVSKNRNTIDLFIKCLQLDVTEKKPKTASIIEFRKKTSTILDAWDNLITQTNEAGGLSIDVTIGSLKNLPEDTKNDLKYIFRNFESDSHIWTVEQLQNQINNLKLTLSTKQIEELNYIINLFSDIKMNRNLVTSILNFNTLLDQIVQITNS